MRQKHQKEMVLYARAKINLSLAVVSTRPDGYHELDMLMQSIGLSDTLTLRESETIELRISADESIPNDQSNLACKAARKLQEACNVRRGVSIGLEKKIPSGAGLGGGSADAAAVLYGLNRLWNLHLSDDALLALSVSLGADVPFCIQGGLCRAQGIGQKLTAVPAALSAPLVIVKPDLGLSTANVFSAYDALPEKPKNPSIDAAIQALASGQMTAFTEALGNALQPSATLLLPEIDRCIEALKDCGALVSQMTGSGSAVFGLFSDDESAQKTYARCRQSFAQTYLTRTVGAGVEGM